MGRIFPFFFCVSDFSTAFSIIKTNYEVAVGGKLQLTCQTDGWWEYCNWIHTSRCEFEWKRRHDAVKMQSCMGLNSRVAFTGNYDSHECQIEISNATSLVDAGNWTCDIESYVFGPIRGDKDIATINVI